MYARTTLFEIDTLRISLDAALERFQERILPALKAQPAYRGVLVMETPEGRGMLVTFWESEAAAEATLEQGFYDEQVSQFLMFLRQPPGREHYEVILHEMHNSVADALVN